MLFGQKMSFFRFVSGSATAPRLWMVGAACPHIGAAGDYVGTRIHPTIHNRGAVADPAEWLMIHMAGDVPSEMANYA